jgi:hypothetical protein
VVQIAKRVTAKRIGAWQSDRILTGDGALELALGNRAVFSRICPCKLFWTFSFSAIWVELIFEKEGGRSGG